MEQDNEIEAVFFVTTPFETSEEEIVSNFLIDSSEDQVIVVKGDNANDGNTADHDVIAMDTSECSLKGENEVLIVRGDECSIDVPMKDNSKDSTVVNFHKIVVESETSEKNNSESGCAEDKFSCNDCRKKFSKIGNRTRHMRRVHGISNTRGSDIRCIECCLTFKTLIELRKHLQQKHKLNMAEEEWHFPNVEAFKKWKLNIERRDLVSFTLRHGGRVTVSRGRRWMYTCHRSGKFLSKIKNHERKRILKAAGSVKLGITCTATMEVEEKNNEVILRYCPHHYGHGKETSFVQLSNEERIAIQENVSAGIPFEDLLDDLRDAQSSADTFQLNLLKKKDFRFINKALASEEYNPGLSDAESVDQWVRLCCQMDESPILFYRREESVCGEEEEFLLIIMTEFQKQLLLSAPKQVVCIDSCYRRKGGRFYLTCLFIMDELDVAFPTAFCISNKVNKSVISQFVGSIRDAAGPLLFEYFVSDSEDFYYDAWKEEMGDDAKWLWSTWYVDSRVRTQLRIFKGNVVKRTEVYKTLRVLLECQNINVFQSVFKNYLNALNEDPECKPLAQFIEQKFRDNAHMWAYCYRKDIKMNVNLHLEVMHRTFRFLCREGRKIRMDKFIFIVMKLVRNKMLDRLATMLDEEKTQMAVEAINMFHGMGIEIQTEHISCLSEKIWLIKNEEEEEHIYVTRLFDKCPELCNLKCSECDICVHMYSCSCVHSMINANLCQHIHAVVWKFLTPHFSPPASPGMPDVSSVANIISNASGVLPDNCSDLLEIVLKRTHDVYTKVRASKCSLTKEALTVIMHRLNECIDICSGKVQVPFTAPLVLSTMQPKNNILVFNPFMNKENSSYKQSVSDKKSSAPISSPATLSMFPKILPKPTPPLSLLTTPGNLSVNGQQYMLVIPGNS